MRSNVKREDSSQPIEQIVLTMSSIRMVYPVFITRINSAVNI